MLKRTRIIIMVGILGSFVSLYTAKKGWGELYPFFYYKLYSRPTGMTGSYSTIRVYVMKEDGGYERINRMPDNGLYDQDDFMYQMYGLLKDTTDAKEETNRKIKLFVQSLLPRAESFQIVEEIYSIEKYDEGKADAEKRILMEYK